MVTTESNAVPIIAAIKKLPPCPGVYLFKDAQGMVMYIGKAKNLKKRCTQYVQRLGTDVKVDTIFAASVALDYQITATEVEALLLEAKLIQSYQPPCNVLLKSGQPFVYVLITSPSKQGLPEIKIVRNQRQKGSYFGPFLEKNAARKVVDFLLKTFRLKLCKKKITNGCLYYHMGMCAGACRADFDEKAYLDRLELAKLALRSGHKKFLIDLQEKIAQASQQRAFERARELHQYHQAFESFFNALDHRPTDIESVARKDIWLMTEDRKALFVFSERNGALTVKRAFYFPFADDQLTDELFLEYFVSFYRNYAPPAIILTNSEIPDAATYAIFLQQLHHKEYAITITHPQQGHFAALVRLATVHAQQEQDKRLMLPKALKQLLKLPFEPRSIDCFDISHKQGMFMVGSCVRFTDGQPDKVKFRHFHIKTVEHQDDYACLREIVTHRYREGDLPDLIVIDGGKGQLNAVSDLVPQVELASLAKREETVFSRRLPYGKRLDIQSYSGQLLIALRDYAHHFAISFHRKISTQKA